MLDSKITILKRQKKALQSRIHTLNNKLYSVSKQIYELELNRLTETRQLTDIADVKKLVISTLARAKAAA